MIPAGERVYPVSPKGVSDARFTVGLALDISALLESQGYPRLSGRDFVDLQLALIRFLYGGGGAQ
ncbi:hypothetical protein [Streptomyces sp. NPDC002537]